tara:strand:+ start:239 stop:466 length:228 start_codon:yes stop_codon:yes gene_type:complete
VSSNLYVVDIIIGDGMVTVENENFLTLIEKILKLYDRHEDDFNLMRATAYWDGGEVADVKLKVLQTIKQRRHDAS